MSLGHREHMGRSGEKGRIEKRGLSEQPVMRVLANLDAGEVHVGDICQV